jgi:putative sterol carrier protein
MSFPTEPLSPARFFEEFLPRAFAEAGLPPGSEGLDVKLGIRLTGEGGGEWVFHVANGSVRVTRAPRDETAFSVCQSVADWRGALWEGRGGALATQAMAIFRPGAPAAEPRPGSLAAPSPAALAHLAGIDGLIRVVVAGGPCGDWQVDFKLGPGPIPQAPTTKVTVAAEDAEQMQRGTLNPLDAFMAGRIQLEGDIALVMQLQAAQLQAQSRAAAPAPGERK